MGYDNHAYFNVKFIILLIYVFIIFLTIFNRLDYQRSIALVMNLRIDTQLLRVSNLLVDSLLDLQLKSGLNMAPKNFRKSVRSLFPGAVTSKDSVRVTNTFKTTFEF
jgi:hypothetical protein